MVNDEKATLRWYAFLRRCLDAGVITYRQFKAMEGSRPSYKPERLIRQLCNLR